MAAGTLAVPGTKHGPCAEECQHRDCAATRRSAEGRCRICGELIGYGTRVYWEDGVYVHADCVEDEAERG